MAATTKSHHLTVIGMSLILRPGMHNGELARNSNQPGVMIILCTQNPELHQRQKEGRETQARKRAGQAATPAVWQKHAIWKCVRIKKPSVKRICVYHPV